MSSSSSSSSSSSGYDEIIIETIKMAMEAYKTATSDNEKEEARLDDEKEEAEVESSRSRKRTRKYIERDRVGPDDRLCNDYFGDNPVYTDEMFRQRFRMCKDLFLRIVQDISNRSVYFRQRNDCRGKIGFSPLQKCTAAIRQLAYGTTTNEFDEYLPMAERTSAECLHNFCRCLIEVFSDQYLRKPNADDIQRLYNKHLELHGFPGMLGSIKCMHWPWKNFPTAWKGQYTRDDQGRPTIMLEAVASYDLWIWHAFCDVTGSNNDFNVLNQSPFFNDILSDKAPSECPFQVNGAPYTKGYYLADEIYPEWAAFVKTFPHPQGEKRKKFKKAHESARKDVERAFSALQSRWAIVRAPARSWSISKIKDVMYACIILHNMIVENEGYAISSFQENVTPPINLQRTFAEECEISLRKSKELRDKDIYINLRSDLVEHVWQLPRPENNQD